MNILKAAVICLSTLIYIFRTIYATHMFQLNSYKNETQIKWHIKNSFDFFKKTVFLILGIILALTVKNTFVLVICVLIASLISIVLNFPPKAKKPLVYTKRIVRLLITDLLIYIAFNLCNFLLVDNIQLQFILQMTFCILAPFVLLLANFINMPIELAINNYYINDAKKIIRSHKSLITIGVTGSYGKTSVKFMLGTLLGAKYNVLVTPESYNTPLGITKTIRKSLRATHDIFVCEMGAKYVGEIKEICNIVNPNHGIITSIGPQHLETFKTLENVIKTKFELADSLPDSGMLFLNGEDINIRSNHHYSSAITYGFSSNNNYYASDICVSSKGTSFIVHHNSEQTMFNTVLLGQHNVLNLLGAIAICCELGIELNKLPPFVKIIQPVEHRLQLSHQGNTTVIDDAYNSNPSGVKAAMNVLSLFDGFKIVVTPGMVELGDIQEEENYKFGALMAKVCDFVVLVGPKQTAPILKGLTDNGFDSANIFITSDLTEGANKAFSLQSNNSNKIVLFENDLPDNY